MNIDFITALDDVKQLSVYIDQFCINYKTLRSKNATKYELQKFCRTNFSTMTEDAYLYIDFEKSLFIQKVYICCSFFV